MTTNSSHAAGPKHKFVEAGVALLIALFGIVVIIGSLKAGINWGAEGPRAGFFPFYIGLFIIVSSVINFWHILRDVCRLDAVHRPLPRLDHLHRLLHALAR
jgi:hypothetical protein